MNTSTRELGVALSFCAATFAVLADDAAPMAKDDVMTTLSGKTMAFKRPDGQMVSWYFAEGGNFILRTPDSTGNGTWNVKDDGQFCVNLRQMGAASGCRSLFKTESGYSYSTSDTKVMRPIESIK
jgi:hypothetical protein